MTIEIKDRRHLHRAAKELLRFSGGKKIFAFYGSMGAGKTTIIKAVCSELGAIDITSSPTFTLVNEYNTETNDKIFHIDFYRIKRLDEVFDFGVEEYLTGEHYCFMEWPELVEDILPEDIIKVKITTGQKEERYLTVS